jgi:tetratricopeptide (TPR) repeat protein
LDGQRVATAEGLRVRVRRPEDLTLETVERRRLDDLALGVAWHERQAATAADGKRWFSAQFHLNRLLESSPKRRDFYLQRMRARVKLGKVPEAVNDLEKFFECWPNATDPWQGWRPEFDGSEDRLLLKAEIDRRLAGKPHAWILWAARAATQYPDPAMARDLERAIASDPSQAVLWAALARLQVSLNHPDQAEDARKRLVGFYPDLTKWHQSEATGSEGKIALWHWNHLVASEPANLAWRRRRAQACLEAGEWKLAGSDLSRVLEAHPKDWIAQAWWARVSLALGDSASYRKTCERLLNELAGTQESWLAMPAGRACALTPESGANWEKVVAFLEKGLSNTGGSEISNAHGLVLLRAGRLEEAVKRLEEARGQRGEESQARDDLLLALAHQRLGHAKEAREACQRAVDWHNQTVIGAAEAIGLGTSGSLFGVLKEAIPSLPENRGVNWADWQEIQLWRREFESMLIKTQR